MIGNKLGHRLDTILALVARILFGKNVNPHVLTLTGLAINLGAGYCLGIGYWVSGGVLILVAGLFDLMDGAVARQYNKVSTFGGFLDSVIDRYSDSVLLIGIIWYYGTRQDQGSVLLACAVLMGSMLIPYSRAKAEIFLERCNIGLMERAERTILLSLGSIFNLMTPVLWLLAACTHITVLQRIHYTWKRMRQSEEHVIK
ncbi:MAG TPA: CDP-alcohol phosphatidyltransferase family protein [Thermodesulfobacteriota bacterium]|nr:CDP-alcohol phosphatidyltransferase family protein [Deltaproteobacteria bacterium]HNR11720.1 CDP-alcohol phosphatidyltransferase family protein [Thermodesulfobacteriota bacterium]HNU72870.1 CDP-alcohol phosphatidyltransferase family protein [Thermodesulfobacteriota bacterium]HQO77889.1 CDP-alcohol phosphatidyltransferase family protein [Thermodesulfobacteriota bacterium]